MRYTSVFASLLFAATAIASPAEAVAAAARDLASVAKEDRPHVRYFSLYAIPVAKRPEFVKVFAFHVNSLSRKAKLQPLVVPPGTDTNTRQISDALIRVDLRDFKWDAKVFDKLATVDPYFHEIVKVQVSDKSVVEVTKTTGEVKEWPGGVWPGDGKFYAKGAFKYQDVVPKGEVKDIPAGKETPATAGWLPSREMALLVTECETRVPILRADWFFVQTAVNAERAAGYYAFLELKSRDDFNKLIGLNVKEAQRIEREVAAIVQDSGVSIRNRQIYRFGAIDAGYWQTRDVFQKQTKERNAINTLNGDFVHDAEEHYGFLPNRLFAYYLSDAKGVQQDTAPDQVGPDTTSPNNDYRIHVFKSCVTCHLEGLRPIDDYGRKLFTGPTRLATYDKKKFERLEQLYLLPLQKYLDRDTKDYSDTLAELLGKEWTTKKLATSYKTAWKEWYVEKVTPEIAARELGHVTAEQLVKAIRHYATPVDKGGLGQLVPNVLIAFAHDKPLPMLREHWEEVYAVCHLITRGLVPAVADEKKKP